MASCILSLILANAALMSFFVMVFQHQLTSAITSFKVLMGLSASLDVISPKKFFYHLKTRRSWWCELHFHIFLLHEVLRGNTCMQAGIVLQHLQFMFLQKLWHPRRPHCLDEILSVHCLIRPKSPQDLFASC